MTHIFKFYNKGNSTLTIDRVKAGWGCTGSVVSSRSIPAGGSGEIEITLYTDERSGQIHKTISVYSNDPDRGIVVLTVIANVPE